MYYIGADAGGTKTRAAIINNKRQILFEYQTGPGNAAVNFQEAKRHIAEAIAACLRHLGNKPCQAIVLGIAGIGSGSKKQEMHRELFEQFHCPIIILTDAELAFYSIFQEEEGVLAIAGTGSVFLGRKNGSFKYIGGWGHLLGDEGSGYDIGITALKQAAFEFDQGHLSSFSKKLLGNRQIKAASDLKEFVYSSPKSEIAALSKDVYILAKQGEKPAVRLLEEAGKILAEQTVRLINLLDLRPPIHIAVRGGLLEKNEFISNSFNHTIESDLKDIQLLKSDKEVVTAAPIVYRQSVRSESQKCWQRD